MSKCYNGAYLFIVVLSGLLSINFLLLSTIIAQDTTIVINEVLASNATGITDEDGDNEDWIELYNYGETPVDLTGYGLSDDYDNPSRWIFPGIVIQPGEFMLIWASGKDRVDAGNPLHTNFRIDFEGEEVIITSPDGKRIDELEPVKIPTDLSYGRKPDGGDDWYYFDNPTPGEANTTESYNRILEPPIFSKQGGFYQNQFELSVTHPDPDVTIVYSLDGSIPCIDNLNSTTYKYKNEYTTGSQPGEFLTHQFSSHLFDVDDKILITDRTSEPNKLSNISSTVHSHYYKPDFPVYKGSVIRARSYKEDMLPSDIVTNTYFVTPGGNDRYSIPVISLSIQENFLFDYEAGIYTPGEDADKYLDNQPGDDFSWPYAGNYRRRGIDWEQPANVELYDPTGEKVVDQEIGVRIHGGATRGFPMKSLRLYARNDYSNSHFDYSFFSQRPHDKFKRLILRNSGNDFPTDIWEPGKYSRTMFRDAAIQSLVSHMNIPTQAYVPTVVFINGEYWGIQNIRERYDKHYLNRVYGVDPENIDLLYGNNSVKEGDNIHYNSTIEYIEKHGLKEAGHYDHILTRIDVENFIDYQIAHIYADNTDWPGNNNDFWRLRADRYIVDSKYGHDGRWRWMLFDTDFGFGLWGGDDAYKHNTLAFATEESGPDWPNPDWSTFLLRSFLENETFRTRFINRFADLLNTAFLPERGVGVINELKQQIAPEIEEHFARWGYPDAYDMWQDNVDVMVKFAEHRPLYQRKHIREHFGLNGFINVNIDVSNQLKGYSRINSLGIKPSTPGVAEYPYPWSGKYFKDIPIEIEAIAYPGYKFSYWEGGGNSTNSHVTINANEDINIKAHFKKTDKPVLLHYWLFDDEMPNNTPLKEIDAYYSVTPGLAKLEYISCLEGYPFEEDHPYWRKASMERRNNPTPINYRPEGNQNFVYHKVNMRGLQVRQPFIREERDNQMIFHLPTSGFSDIIFRFAAKDEGAVDDLIIDYSIDDENDSWIVSGLSSTSYELSDEFAYYEIDMSDMPGVNNNPDLKIRIRFYGDDLETDEGNRVTFNNISLDGIALDAHVIHASAGNNGYIHPSGNIPVYHGGNKEFLLLPGYNHVISGLFIDGESMIDSLKFMDDSSAIYEFSGVSADHSIHAEFSLKEDIFEEHGETVILYPNPAREKFSVASEKTIKRIDIVNVSGQVLERYNQLSLKDFTIKTDVYDNGFYIVIVYTEDTVVSKKVHVIK